MRIAVMIRSLLRRNACAVLAVFTLMSVAGFWSDPAAAWWNDQWTLRKKITIDTGATGANITDPIGTAQILVRLHVGNFRFGSAKEDGGDLRFVAADDKTPLKHHVEKYDSLLGEALVWVTVPDLKAGAKSEIWLYYGNPKAPTAVDPKGSYDEPTLLVYHFADRGTPAQDVTAWTNTAQTIVPGADAAIIGQGARFDGQTTLTLPASPSLAVAEGGAQTLSLWVKMAAPQPRAVLYSRREGQARFIIGLDNGAPFVEVTSAGATQRSGEAPALTAGTWRHLAVTAEPGKITLHVDGTAVSTLAASLPAMSGAATVGGEGASGVSPAAAPAGDAMAGGGAAAPAAPAGDASAPAAPAAPAPDAAAAPVAPAAAVAGGTASAFTGDIDELQIAKVVRPAGFIKIAAIGQGPEQGKLIAYSVDEETSSWLSGYFAVILQSVTLDGWIVIALLAIMAVISWIVMIDKVSYLNRTARGNKLFLEHFRDAAADLDGLLLVDDQEMDAIAQEERRLSKEEKKKRDKAEKSTKASPLFRLFHMGAREIRRRFASDGRRTLSPQAIEAIRAVLDSGFVQETQRLNKLMVVLTIAISGGPFLGLLGTVVGVMITFAAIAATGDVNVNAIAPGIAAALVATVAGLGVAIPALFGYNYLITRIKDATSEMQVFLDEFVTRMAESYHARPDEPRRMAAE